MSTKSQRTREIKKLLICNQSLAVGGAEIFLTDLLRWFVRQGTQVHAMVVHPTVAQLFRDAGVQVVLSRNVTDIVGNWKGLLKTVLFLVPTVVEYVRFLRKHSNADGILLSGFPEKILVSPLAKLLHTPVAWIEFGPLQPLFGKFLGLPFLLYSMVKKIPSKVIVPSQHTGDHITQTVTGVEGKMYKIPCGRDFSQLHISKKLRVSGNTIVCISRLEPGKGQDLLITALQKVLVTHPKTTLQIVGTGDFLTTLKSLTKQLHVEKNVVFTGWVDSVDTFLSSATLAVFPSMWQLEGFGMVAIEAMATGVPLVGFDRGPLNEIVSHGRDGLLARSGDVESLSAAINSVLSDKKMQAALVIEAKKTIAKKYTIEKVGIQYQKVLAESFLCN